VRLADECVDDHSFSVPLPAHSVIVRLEPWVLISKPPSWRVEIETCQSNEQAYFVEVRIPKHSQPSWRTAQGG
jgi:hypothetical protein